MTPTDPPLDDRSVGHRRGVALSRRRFAALGLGIGSALLAGCTAGPTTDGADDGGAASPTGPPATTTAPQGRFRLLISDQPVDIDEFDSLEVSLAQARVFGGPRGPAESQTPTDTPTETETATTTETDTPTGSETATATEADDEGPDDGQGGFYALDLGGATVDLTEVVGDKAMGVYDGPLAEGRYTKIELYAADVGGVVDGEPVDVKLPSGKLKLTKPFEVVAGESVSFVFDIGVVRKGGGGYNLRPVISESGVAGQDVPVEEVGADGQPTDAGEAADGEGERQEGGNGPPNEAAGGQ